MEHTNHSLVIEPGKTELHYWKDLWHFRELLYFLSWRDVIVRYKQTVIGIAWAVVRPFVTMVVFTIVFGKLAQMPSDNAPYPILVFVGLLPWQFFAGAFSDAGNSLISNSNMISKVYFPRLLVPASAIVVNLVDFVISAGVLALLMIWYSFMPDWRIIALPIFILLAAFVALGSGLLVAAMNVKYRDFRYVLPFVVQFGLYISPVGFVSSVVPEQWRLLYYLNPMVAVIDGFRWAILGEQFHIYVPGLLCSILMTACLCYLGVRYFRSTEKTFVDVL